MTESALSRPPKIPNSFRRVGILFAGGPAPAANAVISTAAVSFLRNDIQVVGILHGYSRLVEFGPEKPLREGADYVLIDHKLLRRTRNSPGILIGTAPDQPRPRSFRGRATWTTQSGPPHCELVYEALNSLQIDALVSIGGSNT